MPRLPTLRMEFVTRSALPGLNHALSSSLKACFTQVAFGFAPSTVSKTLSLALQVAIHETSVALCPASASSGGPLSLAGRRQVWCHAHAQSDALVRARRCLAVAPKKRLIFEETNATKPLRLHTTTGHEAEVAVDQV